MTDTVHPVETLRMFYKYFHLKFVFYSIIFICCRVYAFLIKIQFLIILSANQVRMVVEQ